MDPLVMHVPVITMAISVVTVVRYLHASALINQLQQMAACIVGVCDDGLTGLGRCTCTSPYRGDACNWPVITGITPANGMYHRKLDHLLYVAT
jgi:hypothetical protein